MKEYRRSGAKASCNPDLGNEWRRMVSFMLQSI
jgi:hypothetical protein